ncbi:MAG: hypothetical protein KBG20_20605 [Caldilineaceae bacterium]|nr:hypothetical protein [Caldilineaceae bacterium]MBP8108177.1 hypothetical protein [Caldilineaceae bacterium]MBP8125597.1 hypothetical protein [Caldilineaceae bacterium]MBP9074721.1 hypothetical protein [Caldilineaceae bacterium]
MKTHDEMIHEWMQDPAFVQEYDALKDEFDVEHFRSVAATLEARYGMTYEQFEDYLSARSKTLIEHPSPELGQAVMTEEDDAQEWKIAREMTQSFLGLQNERTTP